MSTKLNFTRISIFALLLVISLYGTMNGRSAQAGPLQATLPAMTSTMAATPGTPLEPGDKVGTLGVRVLTDKDMADPNFPGYYIYCADHTVQTDAGFQPGSYPTTCTMPPVPVLNIGPAWTVYDPTLMDANWAGLTHELSVDGQPIDLPAFGTLDIKHKVTTRQYKVALENLTVGRHTVHLVTRLAQDLNDGKYKNAAGVYDYTYTLLVQECPVKLEGTPAAAPTLAATKAGPPVGVRAGVYGFVAGFIDRCGVRVAQLIPGGQAEKIGLHADDVIVAFNGILASSRDQVLALLGSYSVGDAVKLTVERDSTLFTTTLTILPAPPSATLVPTPAATMAATKQG